MLAVITVGPTWTRTFRGGDATQISVIRGWVTALVPDALAWPVALAASELATNALLHTRSGQAGGDIAVSVRTDPDGAIRLAVTDNGTQTSDQTDAINTETTGTGAEAVTGAGGDTANRSAIVAMAPGEHPEVDSETSTALDGEQEGQAPGGAREGGRGLSIVDACAAEWGISGDETGHTTWAIFTRAHDASLSTGGCAAAQPGRAATGS